MITVNDYESSLDAANIAKSAGFKLVVGYDAFYHKCFKLCATHPAYTENAVIESFDDLDKLIFFCKVWKLSRLNWTLENPAIRKAEKEERGNAK